MTKLLLWERRSHAFPPHYTTGCSSSTHKCQQYNVQVSELPHESMLQCYYTVGKLECHQCSNGSRHRDEP